MRRAVARHQGPHFTSKQIHWLASGVSSKTARLKTKVIFNPPSLQCFPGSILSTSYIIFSSQDYSGITQISIRSNSRKKKHLRGKELSKEGILRVTHPPLFSYIGLKIQIDAQHQTHYSLLLGRNCSACLQIQFPLSGSLLVYLDKCSAVHCYLSK